MDSRDIKENVPFIDNGQYLEKIYELQKELIDNYVKIEGLPEYPIDVNTKKNQALIKDFVGRVIEELCEGYESMLLIDNFMIKNNYLSYNIDSEEYNQGMNHLQNVNEEMADALHFMVELLIYVNIQPEDILRYIQKEYFRDLNAMFGNKISEIPDIVYLCMELGYKRQVGNNMLTFINFPTNGVNLLNEDRLEDCDIKICDINLYQAGHIWNNIKYNDFKKCLWDVVYHLNIARNFLKNKPWKQSQMMTDEVYFQKEVVEAFIDMMGSFKIIGLNPKTLFYIYFKKNRVNKFRQKSNY